ncbi:MAG TPA: hypothetical protein VD903_08225 [Pseudonocardia sp.]|nr:hypothetical protein [Pseudonocardia sp.]
MRAGLPGGYRANARVPADREHPAPLTALALSCTVTPSPDASSTEVMTDQVLAALGEHGLR